MPNNFKQTEINNKETKNEVKGLYHGPFVL